MDKTILKITLCLAMSMMLAFAAYGQQSKPISDLDYIESKMKRLKDYRQDLMDVAKFHKNDLAEYGAVLGVYEAALNVDEYLNSSWSLVYIYSNLSCEIDRAMVASMAKLQIGTYVRKIGTEIGAINSNLSITKTAAIAIAGTRLKDELREIKDRLEAIKLN